MEKVDTNILIPDLSYVKSDTTSKTGDLIFSHAYKVKHEQDINFMPPALSS